MHQLFWILFFQLQRKQQIFWRGTYHDIISRVLQRLLNPKMAGGVNLTLPPCIFSKNVFSRERVEYYFFVNLNIIISHIFAEKFMETFQLIQKIFLFSINNFDKFFVFFVAKSPCSEKLMTSAYCRCHQYFVTCNLL